MQLRRVRRRYWQSLLIFGDFTLVAISLSLANAIRFKDLDIYSLGSRILSDHRFFIILFLILVSNYIFDLYEPRQLRTRLFSPLKIVFAGGIASLAVFSLLYLFAVPATALVGRGVFGGSMAMYVSLSILFRLFVDKSIRKIAKKGRWLFLAPSDCLATVKDEFDQKKSSDQFVGLNLSDVQTNPFKLSGLLEDRWEAIVVDGQPTSEVIHHLMNARLKGQYVIGLQAFYEYFWGKVPIRTVNDSWFTFTEGFYILHSRTSVRIKRVMDIILALLVLTVAAPLMALTAILVLLETGRPILFKQVRVGKDGKNFVLYKFRTMYQDAEKDGPQWAKVKDARITKLGRFLRKSRLDELPQAYNVLVGDMSFVGPRPERPEFTKLLLEKIPFYDYRHLIKPGLTGWAQVMYRYGADEEDALEKLQYELFYIKNFSIELDVRILLRTVGVVLFGAGR